MKTLGVGDSVPEFQVLDDQGNEVSLSDFKGKKTVVFFYPRANTPGCTEEGCNLRDHYKELQEAGYTLYGVSADTQRKQSNFRKKFSFPFPLLADVDRSIIDAFGVWGPKKFMGRIFDGIHRKTFVLNEAATVTHVIDKVKTKNHAAQILEL